MDIEQLKLVLEAINAAGGETKEFGFWWLACRSLSPVLCFVFFMTALVMIVRTINRFIKVDHAAYEIAGEVDYAVHCYWDRHDTAAVIQRIRDLKKKAAK
jgi:hypothetical protein